MNLNDVKTSFDRDGFVKLPQLLNQAELRALRNETGHLIEAGWKEKSPPHHYFHGPGPDGEDIFHRVQFLFGKAQSKPNPYLALLGHPLLLALAHTLLNRQCFVLSGEALVFKTPRNGREVPIHCDGADGRPDLPERESYFNIDVYLDDSTQENGCLLAAPGSHRFSTWKTIQETGFNFPGLVPVEMQAGDVLIHNTRLVHGSHASRTATLRRTIYYEFRRLDWVLSPEHAQYMNMPGQDLSDWARRRVRLIQRGIAERTSCDFARGEIPFSLPVPPQWPHALPAADETVDLTPSFGGAYF